MTSKKNRGIQLGGIRPGFLCSFGYADGHRSTKLDSMRAVSKAKCIANKKRIKEKYVKAVMCFYGLRSSLKCSQVSKKSQRHLTF
jgi:hypothetical protein